MAITEVKELWAERDSQQGKDRRVTNTRIFQVISDTVNDGPVAIRTATDGTASIPTIGAGHPEDGTICSSVGPAKMKDASAHRSVWIVPVKYETNDEPHDPENENGGGDETNRTDRAIRFGTERVTVVKQKDGAGRAIVASNGRPYGEGVEIDVSMVAMTISATVDFDAIDGAFIQQWRDTVHAPGFAPKLGVDNPDAIIQQAGAVNLIPQFFGFNGFEPRLVDFGAATELIGDESRWRVNMKILIWNWLDAFLDQGVQEGDNVEINFISEGLTNVYVENLRNITDANGDAVCVPVPLNGAGAKQPDAEAANLKWNVYAMHKSGNLNAMMTALDLPNKLIDYKITIE